MVKFIVDAIRTSLSVFTWRDVFDIILVAIIVYQALLVARNTRAFQIIKGVAILLVIAGLTNLLGLSTLAWVFNQVLYVSSIAIIVVFQPELRRALERIGRGRSKTIKISNDQEITLSPEDSKIVEDMVTALTNLAKRKVGALIVVERKTGLEEHIATGTRLDADISAPLLEQIFEPNTPLHDGAVIMSGRKILSAGCFLPLSDNFTLSIDLGTRHRAAVGISEVSDSITFVVSEETGTISYAYEGKLIRYINQTDIEQLMMREYSSLEEGKGTWANWWKDIRGGKDSKDK